MATVLYLVMIPWFALITLVRIELMAPMLLIITLFGAYANERNIMDVFVAIFFGLFGYFARRHGYPLISLVIGLILGKLAEGSFHQALRSPTTTIRCSSCGRCRRRSSPSAWSWCCGRA